MWSAKTVMVCVCVMGAVAQAQSTHSQPTSATTRSVIPLFQSKRPDASALADDDVRELVKFGRESMHVERPVWLIDVQRLGARDGQRQWIASVYYAPDETTDRIQKGRYFSISSDFLDNWPREAGRPGAQLPEAGKYLRVLPPGEKGDDKIQGDWPFPQPDGYSDAEVLAIVDTIRAGSPQPGAGEKIKLPMDRNQPILSISRADDGSADVMTGRIEGPLSGSGQMVKLRKQNEKWIVVSVGMWIS